MIRKWFVLTILALGIPALCWADDSIPTFHYNNQRTGRTDNIGPQKPQLLWTFKTKGTINGSVVIDGKGTLYVASTDAKLYAVNPDGSQKWVYGSEEAIFGSPAIAPDGSILIGDLSGKYYAVNPDGKEKWLYRVNKGLEKRIICSPVVDASGQSYIGSWNGEFHAVKADGTYRWVATLKDMLSSSPVLDKDNNVYIAEKTSSRRTYLLAVYRMDPSSAAPVWTYQKTLDSDVERQISIPAIDNERSQLIVATCKTGSGGIFAVNLADGKQKWENTLPKGVVSSPAIAQDGTIYVGCLGGAKTGEDESLEKKEFALLYALSPADGKEKWTFQTKGYFILGSPSIDGKGVIYIGDSDGILYAISPEGKELWRYDTQSPIASSPVVAKDGTLYVTTSSGKLLAISNPTAVLDWRTF